MSSDTITVTTTPPDLVRRMENYPRQLDQEAEATMFQAIAYVHEIIPPYPPKPEGSKYIRTGNLGAGLGKSMSGANMGLPSIYEVSQVGPPGQTLGLVGSNWPDYNQYVVGSETQAWMHAGRWWVMRDVARKAEEGVIKLFDKMTGRLARWLDGMGL